MSILLTTASWLLTLVLDTHEMSVHIHAGRNEQRNEGGILFCGICGSCCDTQPFLNFVMRNPRKQFIRNSLVLLWLRKRLPVHWEDPEGSGGEGAGRGDRDGEYM